ETITWQCSQVNSDPFAPKYSREWRTSHVRKITTSNNLSRIIDGVGGDDLSFCGFKQINRPATFPKKRIGVLLIRCGRGSNDLTSVVDSKRTAQRAAESTEVEHFAVFPEE